MTLPQAFAESGATFGPVDSPDQPYRYRLWRVWGSGPSACFVMLNPSTADAFVLDPTVRRCVGFARAWGCGRLDVVNLYALRSTDPRALWCHPDPVGPCNDAAIRKACSGAKFVVAAWGSFPKARARGNVVRNILGQTDVHTLGSLTAQGMPRHPLYLPRTTRLETWECGG